MNIIVLMMIIIQVIFMINNDQHMIALQIFLIYKGVLQVESKDWHVMRGYEYHR